MPRINRVKKSRVERTCEKCRQPIEVGSPYLYFKTRTTIGKSYVGTMHYRHIGCAPAHDEFVKNEKVKAHGRASEHVGYAQSAESPDEAASSLREAISEVEAIIEELEENLSNWQGTGFENSERYSTYEQTKDSLDDWKNDHESIADDLEAMDDEPESPGEEPTDEPLPEDYEEGTDDPDYVADLDDYENRVRVWQEQTDAHEEWTSTFEDKRNEIESVPDLEL